MRFRATAHNGWLLLGFNRAVTEGYSAISDLKVAIATSGFNRAVTEGYSAIDDAGVAYSVNIDASIGL